MELTFVAEYLSSICAGLPQAVHIPYRVVSPKEWHPEPTKCHDNVDRWVKEHPRHKAVHGWVTAGSKSLLTLHSVVKGEDGRLFDITPLTDENETIRKNMLFVRHTGSERDFLWLKDRDVKSLTCDTTPPTLL
jgi:hypothetical protein